MDNLKFIEARCSPDGPYEITQLLNSFLGALAHPLEAFCEDLERLPLSEAEARGWPRMVKERPTDTEPASAGQMIRFLRHAAVHGNIEFLSDGRGEIKALRLWNINTRTRRRTWGAIVTIEDARKLLTLFVDLIEQRHRDYGWYLSGAA
jgi:hypothetical protein